MPGIAEPYQPDSKQRLVNYSKPRPFVGSYSLKSKLERIVRLKERLA